MARQQERREPRCCVRPGVGFLLAALLPMWAAPAAMSKGDSPDRPSVKDAGRTATAASDGARLRLQILQTQRTGATGRGELATERTVAVGDSTRLYAIAGHDDDPDLWAAALPRDLAARQPAYTWQIDATVVAASATETTLNLAWTRSRRDDSGEHEEIGEVSRLVLTSSDFRLLDYVRAPSDSSSACSSLALTIQAEPRLAPGNTGTQPLTLDLWLAYSGKTGERSVRQRAAAKSGDSVPLTFRPLKWSPAGVPVSSDYEDLALGVDIGGSVRATLRSDGLIDVSLDVTRGFEWGHWTSRGGGHQDLRCAAGEAVEIILPDPPAGEATTPMPAGFSGLTAEGVTVRGDNVSVAPARLLSGGRVSLFMIINRGSRTTRGPA
jgi:hypothetical protein